MSYAKFAFKTENSLGAMSAVGPLWSSLTESFVMRVGISFLIHMVCKALATTISDHCPLLLSSLAGPRRPRPFRFENFWTKIPGFQDEVKKAWATPTAPVHSVLALHHKLAATARHLRSWSRSIISDARMKFLMALDVIHRLDVAQETRELSMLSAN